MYHQFRDYTGEAYGSFETFESFGMLDDGAEPLEPGWYWHACFPGCLPDSGPSGPFKTEQDAIIDATDYI